MSMPIGALRLRVIRGLVLCIGVALTLGTPGCGRTPSKPLRVGVNPWPGYEFLYLAQSLGLFAKAGVQVELVPLGSQGDVRRAYERGQIEVAALTLVETLLVQRSQHSPKIFYITDYSNGSDMLLAKSSIADCPGLRGKRIAVEPATVDALMVHYALKSCGLATDDVKIVPMAQAGMPDALNNGEVDAVETYPPASSKVLATNQVVKIFNSAMIPGTVVDVLVADSDALDARSLDFARILRAFDQARSYYEQHQDDALSRISGHLNIKPEELREAFAGISLVSLPEQSQYLSGSGTVIDAVRQTREVLREQNLLAAGEKASPGSVSQERELFDPRPMAAALGP